VRQIPLYFLQAHLYSLRTMAKKIKKVIKVQAKGGQANPAPPLGPALGQAGVDIQAFCTQFNAATKDRMGQVVPVQITVYEDRTFTFVTKQAPASALIKEKAKIQAGSGEPNKKKVGTITQAQLREIATIKMPDLNTKDLESAMQSLAGTARSMGVTVEAA
jgi:large subunit ribosomal protein L11